MPSSACDWSSDVCSSDRSEEHTSELQSRSDLVCRLLLEKKKHTSDLQSRSDLVCRLLLEKKKTFLRMLLDATQCRLRTNTHNRVLPRGANPVCRRTLIHI